MAEVPTPMALARRLAARWRVFGRRHSLPQFIILHWMLGSAMGLGFTALLLIVDPMGLRPLLLHSNAPLAALALLGGGFAISFGGIVAASAVMLIGPEARPQGGKRARVGDRVARPAEARQGALVKIPAVRPTKRVTHSAV